MVIKVLIVDKEGRYRDFLNMINTVYHVYNTIYYYWWT